MQVDPTVLTIKAIVLVAFVVQVLWQLYIFPRLPEYWRCDGILDRIFQGLMALLATLICGIALWGGYAMVFVW